MAITGKVFIIFPTQGSDAGSFEASAVALDRQVYGGKAKFLRTTVSEGGGVTLTVNRTQSFTWDSVHNVDRVLTISHAHGDGPNLAFASGLNGRQPWAFRAGSAAEPEISGGGSAFWKSVAAAMTPGGKILLLGCSMAAGLGDTPSYGSLVARATGRSVYAVGSSFAAGNADTAVHAVRGVENAPHHGPLILCT